MAEAPCQDRFRPFEDRWLWSISRVLFSKSHDESSAEAESVLGVGGGIGEALQHQSLQAHLRSRMLQHHVLLLEILMPSRLIHVQLTTAVGL
jgi:hypothetical protein